MSDIYATCACCNKEISEQVIDVSVNPEYSIIEDGFRTVVPKFGLALAPVCSEECYEKLISNLHKSNYDSPTCICGKKINIEKEYIALTKGKNTFKKDSSEKLISIYCNNECFFSEDFEPLTDDVKEYLISQSDSEGYGITWKENIA